MATNRAALLELLGKQKETLQRDRPRSIYTELIDEIRQRSLIPILSDNVRLDRIFAIGHSVEDGPPPAIKEQLAVLWAHESDYPFPEGQTLARVAQYNLTHSRQSKQDYLTFLKSTLLELAERLDPGVADIIAEEELWLRAKTSAFSFADMASTLEYPAYTTPDEDALRLLARLPLPIYVTTSPHDFIERALRAEKGPNFPIHVQVCFWRGEPIGIPDRFRPDPNYTPSPETPLVYYLFGHEQFPDSMVLTEDDHLEYLAEFARAQDMNQYQPLIPHYLLEALARSSLLLMGYRLSDWDFRVLFRALRRLQQTEEGSVRMALQLDPAGQETVGNPAAAKEYLQRYFGQAQYEVLWQDTERFTAELWQAWQNAQ